MHELTFKGLLELDRGVHIKLDVIDKKIIAILNENARATPLFIATIVGISKSSVRYRIERLKQLDIIRGNTIIVNPYKFGFSYYTIFFRLQNVDDKKELQIMQYIALHPYTIWTGVCINWDVGIQLFAHNEHHLQEIIKNIEMQCSPHVKEIQIIPIISILSYRTIPHTFAKNLRLKIEFLRRDASFGSIIKRKRVDKTNEVAKLDALDAFILKTLSKNATTSFSAMAKEGHTTIDTVRHRIERLIKEQVILSFNPLLNASYLGFQPYVILLKVKPSASVALLEAFLQERIQFAFKTYGIWNYILWHGFENELELFYLVREIRNKFQDAIASFDTISVIKDFKFNLIPEGVLKDIQERKS